MGILTLEQSGWKKVCPVNELYNKKIKEIFCRVGYEVLESDKYLLCKPLTSEVSSPKKMIQISSSLDKHNYANWNGVINSQTYFCNRPECSLHKIYVPDPENYINRFLKLEGFKSLMALVELLSLSAPTQILPILQNHAIPAFFEKHPKGKIYFIRHDEQLATMTAATRVLSDADIFGIQSVLENQGNNRNVLRSMRSVHQAGFDAFIDSTLKTILCGFFPFIYGFPVSRVGGNMIILLNKPIKFEPEKSGFDEFIEGGIFDDTSKNKPIEQLLDLNSRSEIDYEEIYNRYIHKQEFTISEFAKIVDWTVEHLNDFYLKILDLCNFYNDNNFIDFALHRKKFLTLERIFLEINNTTFTSKAFIRKILYFDLHDKLSNLMSIGSQKKDKIFRRLLRYSHFNKKLKKILMDLPEFLNDYLVNFGEEIFKDILNSSYNYIWDESRRSSGGILLREIIKENKDAWIGKKYKDSRTKISLEDYCVYQLLETRHTLHGYRLWDSNYEKYLAIHEGPISDYLPDLCLIWLFIILSDVDKILNSALIKLEHKKNR